MQSIGDVLKKFNPTQDKYISREFQSFGVHLAETLDDMKHKSLYIKMAKDIHRSILEKALSFVVDSNAKNKGALFMWKVTEIKKTLKSQSTNSKSQIKITAQKKKRDIFDTEKVNPNFKTKIVEQEKMFD